MPILQIEETYNDGETKGRSKDVCAVYIEQSGEGKRG